MKKFLLAGIALIAGCLAAPAQQVYQPIPNRTVPLGATSGNVAAATATATLPAVDGQITWICGFSIQSLGATAAATVAMTITGSAGTFTYSYFTVAGVTLQNPSIVVTFDPCMPASGANTPIVVSLPSLGAGNTNANVNAWGYRF